MIKDYYFDSFCGFLIKEHEKFLDAGKIEVKKHAHMINGKGRQNYIERG